MGQKTERIKELETELTAARLLLRHIGDTMGIEFEAPTNPAEAMKEHQRFLTALAKPLGRPAGAAAPLPADNPSPRRRIKAAPGSWDTFDDEVDHQIDRMEAEGLTTPREEAGTALCHGTLVGSPPGWGSVAVSDDLLQSIAGELGLNVTQMPIHEALAAIHEEILRVKNQGADVEAEAGSKFLSAGKSLGQAIAHDHAQAEDLRDAATQARTIVARLAAVMQIGTWDKDGTELLERAQKWEMWKYDLMKRLRELRATRPGVTMSLDDGDIAQRVAEELQRQLDRLLTPKELQNWIKSLERAGATVSLDAGPPVPPYPFEFTAIDPGLISQALEGDLADPAQGRETMSDAERTDKIIEVFDRIDDSRMASEEFARTMNLVILPILARQRAAQKVPDSASQPG